MTCISALEELAVKLGLTDFDLLLVGDGSGTVRTQPCGWYALLYERHAGRVQVHFGAANGGTNNYAELFPYIHALWSFHSARGFCLATIKVAVVSDSEVTVKCGNGEYDRNANGCLWAALAWFEQHGYRFSWKHVFRNTNPLSKEADCVAGMLRRFMKDWASSMGMGNDEDGRGEGVRDSLAVE